MMLLVWGLLPVPELTSGQASVLDPPGAVRSVLRSEVRRLLQGAPIGAVGAPAPSLGAGVRTDAGTTVTAELLLLASEVHALVHQMSALLRLAACSEGL